MRYIKQPFSTQQGFAFFQQSHQRTHSGRLDVFDYDLIFGLTAKGGDAPCGNNLHPLFGLGLQTPCDTFPNHPIDD